MQKPSIVGSKIRQPASGGQLNKKQMQVKLFISAACFIRQPALVKTNGFWAEGLPSGRKHILRLLERREIEWILRFKQTKDQGLCFVVSFPPLFLSIFLFNSWFSVSQMDYFSRLSEQKIKAILLLPMVSNGVGDMSFLYLEPYKVKGRKKRQERRLEVSTPDLTWAYNSGLRSRPSPPSFLSPQPLLWWSWSAACSRDVHIYGCFTHTPAEFTYRCKYTPQVEVPLRGPKSLGVPDCCFCPT